jgi:ketosteroid isomerase-like protein
LKRILSIALLALFAWSPVFAQTPTRGASQGKGRSPQTAGAEAELKKLEREWFDAVVKRDAETLNRILADDFTALNDDGSFVNKAQITDMSQAGLVELDEIKSDEFKLRLYGNTAVVTGRATYIRDRKPSGQSNHIEVWVKRAGAAGRPRWQAVSWVSMPIKASVLGAKAVTTPSGLRYEDIVAGTGASPQPGQEVAVHYTGTLDNGTKFDSSLDRGEPIRFKIGVGQVIRGWDEGLMTMKVGGKRKLVIPPQLGYGARRMGPIPPNSTLVFDVELLSVQ